MVSTNSQLTNILYKLQSWEDIDPLYIGKDTNDIRHKIFHIYARTEISLEILLTNHLLETFDNYSISKSERVSFNRKFTKIIASTDFSKKLRSVKEATLLNTELINKIYELNDLRIIFAHPSAYQDNIKEYQNNPKKQLQTLKLLETVYKSLNEVFTQSTGTTEKQRDEFEKNP